MGGMGFFLKLMKLRNLLLLLSSFSAFGFYSCGGGETTPTTDSVAGKDSLLIVNEMIRKDPGNLELYLKRSKIYMEKKDYGASMMDVDRILAIDSNKAEYL